MHLKDLLLEAGAEVRICDPHAARKLDVTYDAYDACDGSDIAVLGVNHEQFRNIDFEKMAEKLSNKVVFDTRNFSDREAVEKAGIKYVLLGDYRR